MQQTTGMTITINIEQDCSTGNANELLNQILQNQVLIMAAIDDLKEQIANLQTQVDGLQTALDAEQAQVQQLLDTNAGVVTDLNNQITTLQQQLANGATADQIAEVANSLTNISNSLATTRTDLEGTVPDTTSAT